MGGGYYFNDVSTARQSIGTSRSSNEAFDYNRSALDGVVDQVHRDLNIKGKIRECCDSKDHPDTTPIVVAMDVTRSRGDDALRVYEQLPSFLGSLTVSEVVPDPQIMWVAIGDANTDKAPLQVSQFEADRRIDGDLAKIWMEKGGGGTGEESYELAAYALTHHTKLDATRRKKKGFVFFTGDEAPYATVSAAFVKEYIGDKLTADIPTEQVFAELQTKFHPFLIFPRSSMEARAKSIDEEIRQRLIAAGGRFKEVDIRCSLIWWNRNDLDLHCRTPGGEEIYYGYKRASCGGELDVDRNVQGETTKPVENIRWAQGTAVPGKYTFWVENYAYHERDHGPVPFKVELDVNGEIQTFEGEIPANRTGQSSRKVAFEIRFKPGKSAKAADDRAAYSDDVILEKWARYIPRSNILRIEDPASAVEVMLGAMALQTGKLDLNGFIANMKERKVPAQRQKDVGSALKDFARTGIFQQVSADIF